MVLLYLQGKVLQVTTYQKPETHNNLSAALEDSCLVIATAARRIAEDKLSAASIIKDVNCYFAFNL